MLLLPRLPLVNVTFKPGDSCTSNIPTPCYTGRMANILGHWEGRSDYYLSVNIDGVSYYNREDLAAIALIMGLL